MLRPKSKSYHLFAAGEFRPCAAYFVQYVRENHVFSIQIIRECAAFACSCEDGRPGNPVPSHSLSDTSFIHTDIIRVRSDWFSSQVKTVSRPSAASRLIASPFNTIFFIMTGGRSSRAFARMTPDSVRARACAYRSPFFRHLRMIFHNIRTTLRSERGNNRPSLSALSSHCKHGFSVRIIQSLLTFSRGVRPVAVIGNRDARPSFARLYEQFFITY